MTLKLIEYDVTNVSSALQSANKEYDYEKRFLGHN